MKYAYQTLTLILATVYMSNAVSTTLPVEQQALEAESTFWHVYNTCDLEKMETMLAEDIEFYHDKSGLLQGASALLDAVKNNICSGDITLRREAVSENIAFFPLHSVGAIASGEHVFYSKKGDQPEYLDTRAKFFHLWVLENNKWIIKRAFSYDHQPAKSVESVSLSRDTLKQYEGKYQSDNSGVVHISVKDNGLLLSLGDMQFYVEPKSQFVFYHKEQPLTFEFVPNSNERIEKFIVRERDVIVDQGRRAD